MAAELRNLFEGLVKAGRAGRPGSSQSQELVGCDGELLVAAIELAAERTGLLPPGVTFWERRGRRKTDLQIEHQLKVRTGLADDWKRATEVFHWRNLSITTTSSNSAWDRRESPFSLLGPEDEILAIYKVRSTRFTGLLAAWAA